MRKLDIKIRTGLNNGLFHDTRADVDTLAKALNKCIDKINELVEENNKLKKEIKNSE